MIGTWVFRATVVVIFVVSGALTGCSSDLAGPNRAPVAVAGADVVVNVGLTAILDGSASYDPDGDALTYEWSLLAAPAESAAGLIADQGLETGLTPDVAGVYLVALTVNDGKLASERDVVQVKALFPPCESDDDCDDDGLYCNGEEMCQDGRCLLLVPDCSDLDSQCSRGLCMEADEVCVADPVNEGEACDDGLYCNDGETCQSGVCTGGGPWDCSDFDDQCTRGLCLEADEACVADPVNEGLACDDSDPCTTSETCQAGTCTGEIDKDVDGDGFIDDQCGGTDCNDDAGQAYPGAPEGPVCVNYFTCYDLVDNNCDGDTDQADAGCASAPFICIDGPADPVSTGDPTGGDGDAIVVYLDAPGYPTDQIVCFTDDSRLQKPQVLFADDFEIDNGFAGWQRSDPARVSRVEYSPGSFGISICSDADYLRTDPINTLGRSRIQLRYAAAAPLLDDQEYLITEYSPNGGTDWYPLDLQGDAYLSDGFQLFTHILPPSCEDVPDLLIRFYRHRGDDSDCAVVDEVEISDLPPPTVSWTVFANHFEVAEGNSPADICIDETIVGFDTQCNNDEDTCLDQTAQNPASQDATNTQGVYVNDNVPSCLQKNDADTRYVPAGSDLVAEFHLKPHRLDGNNQYANAWYSDGIWKRMNGVGAGRSQIWDWYRFVMEPTAIGLTALVLAFTIPDTTNVDDNRGILLDDLELRWHRSSLDRIGPFSDNADGSYSAAIQSDLAGTTDVTCIFYGQDPPLVSDGTGDSSGPFPIQFEGWVRRRRLTFRNGGQAENLIDFPVPVILNDLRIDYGQTRDQGQDVRFVASDGVSVLPHEIEVWDEAGTSVVWVRVPLITGGSDGDFIWMYYGNPNANDAQNRTAVWDANFLGVWHLAERSGTTAFDSTANGNDGDYVNSPQLDQAGGFGDLAVDFDGGNDYIDLGALDVVGASGDDGITLEAYARLGENTGADCRLISKATGGSTNEHFWMLSITNGNRLRFRLRTGAVTERIAGSGDTNDLQWFYGVATYDGSNMRIFFNGGQVDSSGKSGTVATDGSVQSFVAANPPDTYAPWIGPISEVRLSNIGRSADWIAAQYMAMNDDSADPFVVFGPEEGQ